MDKGQKKTEVIVNCDICNSYRDVKWRCLNCNEKFCEQCKKSHLKCKVSYCHIFTFIKDAAKQKLMSNIFCPEHPNEAFHMYCTTCSLPVCSDCITGKHHQHQFEKMADIVVKKRQELYTTFHELKREKLTNLTKSLDSIIQNQKDYSQKLDQLIAEINIKAEEMKEEIDNIRDNLINKLTTESLEDQDYLKRTQDQFQEELKRVRKLLQESEDKMKEASDTDVMTMANHSGQILLQDIYTPTVHTWNPPVFCTSQVQQKDLEILFGQLVYLKERRKSSVVREVGSMVIPNIQVNILSSFTCEEYVHALSTNNPDNAWCATRVGIWGTKFHLFSKDGNRMKSFSTDCYIEDMAITATGDILATESGMYVKKISPIGKVENFVDVSPYKACGIYITRGGDILVSLKHGSSQPGMIKKGRVVKMTSSGQVKQVIENENIKFNKYTSKIHIVENINGDIWVMEEFNLCIVVLDKNGKFKFTYNGPTEDEMWEDFIPYDITRDRYGHILVADCHNKAIHLVDKDGIFQQYVPIKQEKLYHPSSLTVDSEGKLWIGCNCGQIFVVKYLS